MASAGGARVQLSRVVDRDALLAALHDRGFEARVPALDERCVLIVDSEGRTLLPLLEEWIEESHAPLVPEQIAKRSYVVRPFVG
jgi:hypothetical protein